MPRAICSPPPPPWPAGDYLAACVFDAFFTGGCPEGLPATVTLPADDVKHLQKLGGAVGRSWR